MRRLTIFILLFALVFTSLPSLAQETTHTVQRGDTLYSIARRYGTTVQAIANANGIVNANLIYVGTVLRIPGATTEPGPGGDGDGDGSTGGDGGETPAEYVVVGGDTLSRIARRFNVSLSQLIALNNIPNPNLIYPGQRIRLPGGTASPAPPPDEDNGDGEQPPAPPPGSAPTYTFAYGIQVHLPNQDMAGVAAAADDLGMEWVKQQIEWKVYEGSRGSINFAALDQMVDALEARNLKILFSVVKAPGWARNTEVEDGPPTDFNDYARFVGALAERYRGRVHAYEIWNEQNIRREWNGLPLSAASYVQLLRAAYTAIKTADPTAVVVSGAPAPTGINDGVNAIDDRLYLQQMYNAGLANYSDAIGAHPNGWANASDARCCNTVDGLSHDDHRSFFFWHTLQDYREIMLNHGDSGTFIWATEFGWGTNADIGGAPAGGYEFVQFTTLEEQAQYITEAFALGRQLNYVGPMLLWNLNFCPVAGPAAEQCYWGLIGPDGTPRPAYDAVKAIPK